MTLTKVMRKAAYIDVIVESSLGNEVKNYVTVNLTSSDVITVNHLNDGVSGKSFILVRVLLHKFYF